jgi:WD40 repeat protein/tRNA A-37 threonylcarbamoyl transferase component Bud32
VRTRASAEDQDRSAHGDDAVDVTPVDAHSATLITAAAAIPSTAVRAAATDDAPEVPPELARTVAATPAAFASERATTDEPELGRGGLGRVVLARDPLLGRHVARKELLPEINRLKGDDELRAELVDRFLREARITGQLEHPNIIPVYQLGRRDDGTLFYTMRVVRGRTLGAAIEEANSLEERLRLVPPFHAACQAIAFAHHHGVIHRDIKPDNVMLGEFGQTVVLDWGIAKLKSSDEVRDSDSRAVSLPSSDATQTAVGELCGTPLYMSPEQASGRTDEVDERSDVWALGAMLYTILTGRPPFDGSTLTELLLRIRTDAVVPATHVDSRVPAELSAIALRALQYEREDRYPSARELSDEVESYLVGRRVSAYEYSSLELLRRFVARHRAVVVTACAGLIALVALAAVSYRRVLAARDRALEAERQALTSAAAARASLAEALVDKARLALDAGDVTHAELLAARALTLRERADARGMVVAAAGALPLVPAMGGPIAPRCSRYAHDFENQRVACAVADAISSWSVEKRSVVWRSSPGLGEVLAIARGATSWVVAGQRRFAVLDAASGSVRSVFAADLASSRIDVSRQGDAVASALGRSVAIWEVANGREAARTLVDDAITAVTFDPGGTTLALGMQQGDVALWSPRTKVASERLGRSGSTVLTVAFSPSGRQVATGSADSAIRVWDVAKRALVHTSTLPSPVISLAWSNDGRFLLGATKSSGAYLVDAQLLGRPLKLPVVDPDIAWVGSSATTGSFATAARSEGLRLWALRSAQPTRLIERGNVLAASFVPDSSHLAVAGLGESGVCVWSLSSGTCSTRLPASMPQVRALATSPDGRALAVGGSGDIHVWELSSKLPRLVLSGHAAEIRAVEFSPKSGAIASAAVDGAIVLHDATTGAVRTRWSAGSGVQSVAFLTEDRLASAQRDGSLVIWNTRNGTPQRRIAAHPTWTMGVTVLPGGAELVSAAADGSLSVWEAKTGRRVANAQAHDGRVTALAHSPDGRWVATGGEDHRVRVWRMPGATLVATLVNHTATVRAVRFSPNGQWLASTSDDASARLWPMSRLEMAAERVFDSVSQQLGVTLEETRLVASAQ